MCSYGVSPSMGIYFVYIVLLVESIAAISVMQIHCCQVILNATAQASCIFIVHEDLLALRPKSIRKLPTTRRFVPATREGIMHCERRWNTISLNHVAFASS